MRNGDSPSPSGLLAAIGRTPLVLLSNLFGNDVEASVFGKLELMNPMGSAKDRAAASMLLAGIRDGSIMPGRTTIIESTSGNTGVALAALCKYFRLPLICVVDTRMTAQHRAMIYAFGATIEVIATPDPLTGEPLPAHIRRVRELLEHIQTSIWSNQYVIFNNAAAHRRT